VRQLRRRRLRNQIDTIFEPVRIDDAMQQFGPQPGSKRGQSLNELVWQDGRIYRIDGFRNRLFLS